MQTLSTTDFNNQYPQHAFEETTGFVTFDFEHKIASWDVSRPKSKAAFLKQLEKQENSLRLAKARADRAVNKKLQNKAEGYQAGLASTPTINVELDPDSDEDNRRYNVTYKVGNDDGERNLSVDMVVSLLTPVQEKALLAGKQKKFTIDKYDFASIIVNGARRPGIKN